MHTTACNQPVPHFPPATHRPPAPPCRLHASTLTPNACLPSARLRDLLPASWRPPFVEYFNVSLQLDVYYPVSAGIFRVSIPHNIYASLQSSWTLYLGSPLQVGPMPRVLIPVN